MPETITRNALSIIDSVGELSIKALNRRKVPYAPQNGSSYGSGYNNAYFMPNGLVAGVPLNPGTANYLNQIGDPLNNRVVRACVNAKATAMASAPAIIEKLEKGQWQKVDHDAAHLLNAPNDFHSYYDLNYATTAAEDTIGQAYWRLEFTKGGVPGEIWADHPTKFTLTSKGGDEFIGGYKFQGEAGEVDLEDRQVIHFRRTIDLYNTRFGVTPLVAGHAQIHGDNSGAVYQSAVLENSGVLSLLISLKEGIQAGNSVTTPQIEQFVEALYRKLRGSGAGRIAGVNLPLDVTKMAFSPDEMAVGDLIRYFVVSICALLEVDPILIHMAAGKDAPTYANFKEAVEDFWTRTIVPANTRRDAVLSVQYLPLWGLEPSEYRVARDYSNVSALQEDAVELSGKICSEYKAGIIDRYTAKTRLHYEPQDADKEIYAAPAKSENTDENAPMPPELSSKALGTDALRTILTIKDNKIMSY